MEDVIYWFLAKPHYQHVPSVVEAWNDQADAYTQWLDLDLDEKITFYIQHMSRQEQIGALASYEVALQYRAGKLYLMLIQESSRGSCPRELNFIGHEIGNPVDCLLKHERPDPYCVSHLGFLIKDEVAPPLSEDVSKPIILTKRILNAPTLDDVEGSNELLCFLEENSGEIIPKFIREMADYFIEKFYDGALHQVYFEEDDFLSIQKPEDVDCNPLIVKTYVLNGSKPKETLWQDQVDMIRPLPPFTAEETIETIKRFLQRETLGYPRSHWMSKASQKAFMHPSSINKHDSEIIRWACLYYEVTGDVHF